MAGYKPLYVRGMQTGLVQSRQEFILPDDAYPTLENAFVWRERILRRQGLTELGRLQRNLQDGTILSVQTDGSNTYSVTDILNDSSFNLRATQPNAQIVPTSVDITVNGGGGVYLDTNGDGNLTSADGSGTINYSTGALDIIFTSIPPAGNNVTVKINYYPTLPVMGIRTQEQNPTEGQQTIVFDTIYAYIYTNGAYEELPSSTPTTWTGADDNFFFTTNYWVDSSSPPNKLFWATNFSGTIGDPIRYYNNVTWTNFAPQIDASGNLLTQCLAILPFRGRLLAFNTLEGMTLNGSTAYYQRIRWSAIGSPLLTDAWRDDIRGQGGFLDIPTDQNIAAVGFVRDNLVIYCSRSTWQLKYTGRSIAPFQIEKVNSELGAYSAFSAVQFDTSLVGIGDKGIVECDSYKSERIDIKIPDLVFDFSGNNNAQVRIQGIRDLQQRVAYWTYVSQPVEEEEISEGGNGVYPNRRLVYNYENDSWAVFTDSLTALGSFNEQTGVTWDDADWTWDEANYPWNSRPQSFPSLLGGNQQGFVMYLGSNITPKSNNDPTLTITGITGNDTDPTVITSPNHNLVNGQVVTISGIPTGTPFASSLNFDTDTSTPVFGIIVVDNNNFQLFTYNSVNGQFDIPQLDASGQTYVGYGLISVRDNFNITSKQFNFLENGQNIQMGYLDLLMNQTDSGAITMNVYANYDGSNPINTIDENIAKGTLAADPFFNATIPTYQNSGLDGSKFWHRVYCPIRAAFIQLQFTLSNAQLAGVEQTSDVEIDSQILWLRQGGRLQTF